MTGANATQQRGDRLHVVVIGAGIVGTCCAAWLQRDGHAVTLVEANEPSVGASWGNAGALSPGSCIPLSMPGGLRKVPKWLFDEDGPLVVRPRYALLAAPWLLRFIAAGRAHRVPRIADALRALHGSVYDSYRPLLAAANAESLIRRSGSLVVYRDARGFERGAGEWRMRRERGAVFEVLDAARLHALVPALSDAFQRGVLQPEHGYATDPPALVGRLREHMLEEGGSFVRDRATTIAPAGDGVHVHRAAGAALVADRVVIAAGAWSKALLQPLGIDVPLETQRGYHMHLASPGVSLPLPVSFAEDKFYATPMASGIRLAGTVEFAGLQAPPNFRRARHLAELGRRWLPDLRVEPASEWMGHRPCLPDSLPVIGPIATDARTFLAFGHGHNGMTGAPVTGRMIADMIAGRPTHIDAMPFRPDRF
jgi:D-amino-acid dehydrogenase